MSRTEQLEGDIAVLKRCVAEAARDVEKYKAKLIEARRRLAVFKACPLDHRISDE